MSPRARRPTPDPTTLAALRADPQNRRAHGEANLAMIATALAEVGAARSIVIDETATILAGNGVVRAARSAGLTKLRVVEAAGDEIIAVRRTGLTDAQKRALALFDNRTAELATWNVEQLLADQAAGLDLSAFWSDADLAALLSATNGGPKAGLTDPDAVPEARATAIQRGDLFELGAHRLLCGDSTVAADVARVMGEEKASACITDPPYSVNYERSQGQRGGNATVHAAYHEADRSDILGFMRALPTDILVMSYPVDRHWFALSAALSACRLEIRRELVWVKDSFSFWPSAKYQQRHEPILLCARAGVAIGGEVPTNMSTVFEVPRPQAHDKHPTEKPLQLWRVFVTNHAASGALVFEPFAGSGTTIMACEELGRICRAIEIEPQYCQVTLDRWEAFTGQTAQKVGEAVRASVTRRKVTGAPTKTPTPAAPAPQAAQPPPGRRRRRAQAR